MTRNIADVASGPMHATADEIALAREAGFPPDRPDADGNWVWDEEISEHSFLAVLRAAYAAGLADGKQMTLEQIIGGTAEASNPDSTEADAGITYPSAADVAAMNSVDAARLPYAPDQIDPAFLASGLADYSPLKLHLASRHGLCNALTLTDEDAHDVHEHEHDGPGTIRNHPRDDRSWKPEAVIDSVLEGMELDGIDITEALPHLQPLHGGLSAVCAYADKPVMHHDCVHPHCQCPHHTLTTDTPASSPTPPGQ